MPRNSQPALIRATLFPYPTFLPLRSILMAAPFWKASPLVRWWENSVRPILTRTPPSPSPSWTEMDPPTIRNFPSIQTALCAPPAFWIMNPMSPRTMFVPVSLMNSMPASKAILQSPSSMPSPLSYAHSKPLDPTGKKSLSWAKLERVPGFPCSPMAFNSGKALYYPILPLGRVQLGQILTSPLKFPLPDSNRTPSILSVPSPAMPKEPPMVPSSPFLLPHSPQPLVPGGNPFLKLPVAGATLPGWAPFSLTRKVGFIMPISVGSIPIPDQIPIFGSGPPKKAGFGLVPESIPIFSKTPPPTGFI